MISGEGLYKWFLDDSHSSLRILATGGCLVITFMTVGFWKRLKDHGYLPGYRPLFPPLSIPGAFLPTSRFQLNMDWIWQMRETAYFNQTHDVISILPLLAGHSALYTRSPDVLRQLVGNEGQTQLIKPRDLGVILLLWGENIFTSNGDMWKRHRRIMAPAFTTKTYAMVLKETMSIFREMVDAEEWAGKSQVVVHGFRQLTVRTAFLVISRCGFGLPLPWVADEKEVVDRTSVGHALETVMSTHILRLAIPSWWYKLPIKWLRDMDYDWKSLKKFMQESVKSRSQELANDPDLSSKLGDVFTRLVSARDGEGKLTLDDDEVIGNTFMLMFAGHETTGYVLATALTFLAIYQEEQEKAYQEIISTIGTNRDPTLEGLANLSHNLACFVETARLYPPGNILTRVTPEDMTIEVKHPSQATVVIQKGTLVIFDMVNIHRNPDTFPDPHAFKPSRWYGVSEPDMSMFGDGPRACIGRKFSHIEALTFMSLLLRDWHLDVVLKGGETRAGYEKRVMLDAGLDGMSFGVKASMDLRLTRRPIAAK